MNEQAKNQLALLEVQGFPLVPVTASAGLRSRWVAMTGTSTPRLLPRLRR